MQPSVPLVLIGYRHSIYTRIARMALIAKGAEFSETEVNPFASPLPPDYPHPFARVPVLSHGTFTLYETSAITRYIDQALPGPPLVPTDPKAAARMQQVISIADSYAFRPLVLEVFAHRIFRPLEDLPPDESAIAAGLAAVEAIATEGLTLSPTTPTLADCHLAPMIAAFAMASEGAALLSGYKALDHWWAAVRQTPSFRASGRDPLAP